MLRELELGNPLLNHVLSHLHVQNIFLQATNTLVLCSHSLGGLDLVVPKDGLEVALVRRQPLLELISFNILLVEIALQHDKLALLFGKNDILGESIGPPGT